MVQVLEQKICLECPKVISTQNTTGYCGICSRKQRSGKNHPMFGKKHTVESKIKMSIKASGKNNSMYGISLSGKSNGNYKDGRTNKEYRCIDCDTKISTFSGLHGEGRCGPCRYLIRDISGENNPNWKNGITKIAARIRSLKVYKYWKEACLERDVFTCQDCGNKKTLEVHHEVSILEMIKKYNIKNSKQSKSEPAFWMLENGITYCLKCHCLHDKARYFIFKSKGGG